jgi:hypothetical protein
MSVRSKRSPDSPGCVSTATARRPPLSESASMKVRAQTSIPMPGTEVTRTATVHTEMPQPPTDWQQALLTQLDEMHRYVAAVVEAAADPQSQAGGQTESETARREGAVPTAKWKPRKRVLWQVARADGSLAGKAQRVARR